MSDPFAFMYNTRHDDRAVFGANWCGPDVLPHAKDIVIARYPKPDGGDGHDVEVTCCALPARFYEVRALPATNSVGDVKPGFTLATGSNNQMARWAHMTAKLIADGMIGPRDTSESA